MCPAKCEYMPGGGWEAACSPGGQPYTASPPAVPTPPPCRLPLPSPRAPCSKQISFGVMSPAEIVDTAEFHVSERALYKVGAACVLAAAAGAAAATAASLGMCSCCVRHSTQSSPCLPFVRPHRKPTALHPPHLPPTLSQMPERRPQPNGVLDPRLGVSNKRSICETCGQALADCTGHFGYIRLELPVFHIGYFKNTVQILQCICKSCSHVLLTEDERRAFLRCGVGALGAIGAVGWVLLGRVRWGLCCGCSSGGRYWDVLGWAALEQVQGDSRLLAEVLQWL